MLKFLVDESSGDKLAEALKEKGYDTIFWGEYNPGSPDEEIIEKAEAEAEDRIVITNDKEFGETMFRQRRPTNGLLLLRLKIDKPINRIKYTIATIEKLGIKLKRSFVIVSERKMRIR